MLQLRALRPYTIQRGIGAVLELYQYALYWHSIVKHSVLARY